ncbi:MAG: WG repeat-containing protein [Spirochaetes bacterium]|nr:WG repeat-containing protein [Spirochaetota bacterium]
MIRRFLFVSIYLISTLNILAANYNSGIITLTPQKAQNGKWGYLDEKGSYRIKPQFESALPFKEGLALVSVHKKYGFINERGRPVIHPQFDEARSFCESLAAVMIINQRSEKKWGFIDKRGFFVIKPHYDDVSDFSGLLANVSLDGKIFTINKSGEMIENLLE